MSLSFMIRSVLMSAGLGMERDIKGYSSSPPDHIPAGRYPAAFYSLPSYSFSDSAAASSSEAPGVACQEGVDWSVNSATGSH